MATVVLTKGRQDTIRYNLVKNYDNKANELLERIDAVAGNLARYTYNRLVPADLQKKLKEIPKDYLIFTETLKVRFKIEGQLSRDVVIQLADKLPVSAKHTFGVQMHYTAEVVAEAEPGSVLAIHGGEAIRLLREAYALKQESDTLSDQVRDLFKKVSTLQQLHKIFPTVLEYVDDNTRAMFNRKVERTKVDLSDALDDDLRVALVKANIQNFAKATK